MASNKIGPVTEKLILDTSRLFLGLAVSMVEDDLSEIEAAARGHKDLLVSRLTNEAEAREYLRRVAQAVIETLA